MKNILFRGKRVDNGEWVEGYFCGGMIDEPFDTKIRKCSMIIEKESLWWHEVIPKTVGQYTGLKDKNGTKIFEGDILLVGGAQKVRVFFKRGQFVVDHFAINVLCSRDAESEVIGNVHDKEE